MTCARCQAAELEWIEADPDAGIDEHFYCWKCNAAFDPWLFYDKDF